MNIIVNNMYKNYPNPFVARDKDSLEFGIPCMLVNMKVFSSAVYVHISHKERIVTDWATETGIDSKAVTFSVMMSHCLTF